MNKINKTLKSILVLLLITTLFAFSPETNNNDINNNNDEQIEISIIEGVVVFEIEIRTIPNLKEGATASWKRQDLTE